MILSIQETVNCDDEVGKVEGGLNRGKAGRGRNFEEKSHVICSCQYGTHTKDGAWKEADGLIRGEVVESVGKKIITHFVIEGKKKKK